MEKEFAVASTKMEEILHLLGSQNSKDEFVQQKATELLQFLQLCEVKSRVILTGESEVTRPLKRQKREAYEGYKMSSSDEDECYYSRCDSVEAAKYLNRRRHGHVAYAFWWDCTFDTVLKTCIQGSGRTFTCQDNSFGITWVAVHAMDNSIALVTRHRDLDKTRVSPFNQTQPRSKVLAALHQALTSEVECLPYDDDDQFLKGPSQSNKKPFSVGRLIRENVTKPFSVVSVYPIPEKSDEEAGQLAASDEYDRDKAINFLMGKMESKLVATLNDAIKIAICGFKHLCRKDLEAKEYWVSKWDGPKSLLQHLFPAQVDEYLEVISGEMTA